jgi:hypothetical protein
MLYFFLLYNLFIYILCDNLKYLYCLLIYEYKGFNNYHPRYVNIGDYIQSLASEQFIPNKNKIIYLDRDNIKYNKSFVKIIFNCWYKIKDKVSFPKNIRPLFISFHISNKNKIKNIIKILKKYEPIGARDIDTMKALQKNGIKSYFSSCLTLTLGKTFYSKSKKNIIYLVDYKFKKNILIDLEVLKILKFYQPDELKFMYHEKLSLKTNHKKRFEIAKQYLKKYSQARLVITTRLHCALPCIGMEVPVILVVPNKNKDTRFTGIANTFLNFMGYYPKNKRFIKEILTNDKGFIINDQGYKYYVNKMEKIITNFYK